MSTQTCPHRPSSDPVRPTNTSRECVHIKGRERLFVLSSNGTQLAKTRLNMNNLELNAPKISTAAKPMNVNIFRVSGEHVAVCGISGI